MIKMFNRCFSNSRTKPTVGGVLQFYREYLGTFLLPAKTIQKVEVCLHTFSELVQLKLNIGASDGDSTPPEVEKEPPLIEEGVIITALNLAIIF